MALFRIVGTLLILAALAAAGAVIAGSPSLPQIASRSPAALQPAASLPQAPDPATDSLQPVAAQPQGVDTATGGVAAFVAALNAQGAQAEATDRGVAQPGLAVKGRVIKVNGGEVWAFEFADAAAAKVAAAEYKPGGSTGITPAKIWAPIVWQYDRLVVIYTGQADDIVKPITAIAGKPLSGK